MAYTKEFKRSIHTLTQKQYDFTRNLVGNGFNIEKAMLDAGYERSTSRTQGFDLIQQPLVKEIVHKALDSRHDAIVSKLGMTILWRAKKLKHIIDTYIPDDDHELANTNKVRIGLDAIKEVNKMTGDTAISNKVTFNLNTEQRIKDAKKAYEDY